MDEQQTQQGDGAPESGSVADGSAPRTPVDDKAHIRHELDLSAAPWQRAEPEGQTLEDAVEYAFVPHTDGVTYVAMRQSSQPDGTVLVFTPAEWDAFVAGARDGEFDEPW